MKTLTLAVLCALAFAGSAVAIEPAKHKMDAPATKPLSYDNVVSHFKETGLRVTEVQKRCTIFFEGEFKTKNIYDYCLIVVENSDVDIQVTFYLTGAHEMNWVTEFLDAPFFAPTETQHLFELINSRRDVRSEQIGRFLVDFHKWEPRHAQIIVFSFTRR